MCAFMMFVIMLATTVSAVRQASATRKSATIVEVLGDNTAFNKLANTSALSTVAWNSTFTSCKTNPPPDPPPKFKKNAAKTLEDSEKLLAFMYGPLIATQSGEPEGTTALVTYDTNTELVLTYFFSEVAQTKKLVEGMGPCQLCPSCEYSIIKRKCKINSAKKFIYGEYVSVARKEAILENIKKKPKNKKKKPKLQLGLDCYLSSVYAESLKRICPVCTTSQGMPCKCGKAQKSSLKRRSSPTLKKSSPTLKKRIDQSPEEEPLEEGILTLSDEFFPWPAVEQSPEEKILRLPDEFFPWPAVEPQSKQKQDSEPSVAF